MRTRKYTKRRKSKKIRRTRKTYRKRIATGMIRTVRWSSKDSGNQCHVQYVGNDVNNSADFTAQFSLGDVANFGEFVSLFDNYRITGVKYRWILTRTPDWATTTTLRGYPVRVTWCHDYNDSTSISRLALYQKANLKEVLLDVNKLQTRWYSLRPACLSQIYEGVTGTAYSPKWKQWMDTNDSACPHYGIKGTYSELNAGVGLRLEAKIMMEFKGVS